MKPLSEDEVRAELTRLTKAKAADKRPEPELDDNGGMQTEMWNALIAAISRHFGEKK